jgi:tetratricopeptide (TPR) repeat protein
MSRTGVRRTLTGFGATVLVTGVLSARQSVPTHANGGSTGSRAAEAAALRARGQQLGYNLDHDFALTSFREAIAVDPNHPAAYRLAAATAWIRLLFERGAVTADDYLGQVKADRRRQPPNKDLDAFFREHLTRAMALAEQRCREADNSADAHFQLGAAYSFQATYSATVEGSVFDSLRAARRAYSEHQRVLDLDPSRKDAGLIVGMYRYGVSTLSLPSRVLAHLAGFGGGRERGLKMVEEAAQTPSDIQTNARFALIVIYNREQRYDAAMRVIETLQQQYPRNRLLWLEAGSTSLRAGRPDQARKAIEDGLAKLAGDPRPRAFGELARWRYYHGAALLALKDSAAAERELRAALTDPARAWLQGRIHIELGKLADLTGSRPQAIEEYRLAARLCGDDDDDECLRNAKTLTKRRSQ